MESHKWNLGRVEYTQNLPLLYRDRGCFQKTLISKIYRIGKKTLLLTKLKNKVNQTNQNEVPPPLNFSTTLLRNFKHLSSFVSIYAMAVDAGDVKNEPSCI